MTNEQIFKTAVQVVADHFETTNDAIQANNLAKPFATYRQYVYWLIYKQFNTRFIYSEIGELMKHKYNHATVGYGIRCVNEKREIYKNIKKQTSEMFAEFIKRTIHIEKDTEWKLKYMDLLDACSTEEMFLNHLRNY